MVHLPKIVLWHGTLVLPRPVPLWLPLALLSGTLLVLAVAVNAGLAVMGESSTRNESGSYSVVAAQVLGYVNEWNPQRDPLVTLLGGVQAKASNVYGVDVGGVRYYYQLTRNSSFDPLRAGTARDYEVVAVVDAGTQWEVLIYRLK